MNWQTVKLADVVTAHYGKSLKAEERDSEGEHDVFGSNGFVGKHSATLTQNPTLIIGRKGSVGAVTFAPYGGWTIDTAYYIQIHDENALDLRFLFYALKRADLAQLTITTSIPGLNREDFYRTEIPLPPLPEQKRLASILDSADQVRRLRAQTLEKLDELVAALFLDSFGDPANLPMVNFEDVVFFQEGPGVRKWQFRDEGIKLINIRNLVEGRLVLENTERHLAADEVNSKYKHFLLDAGDFVLASSGVTWGKIAEVFEHHLPLCLNTSIIRIRPLNERISKGFLRTCVESTHFKEQIRRLITGSAQPNFGPSHLKLVQIPLPPLPLQLQFAARVEAIEAVKARAREAQVESDALFLSLQERAFAGAL